MNYLDQTFWRMAFGFVVIISLGLWGVYMLSTYQSSQNNQALTLQLK